MRVSFPWASVQCQSWESRSELERFLNGFEDSRIIAASSEQEREFYSIAVQPDFPASGACRVALGVCSEGHGIQPQLLLLPEHDRLLIGANSQVTAVDVSTGTDAFEIQLESLFRSMVYLSERQLVLVFHEIGVTAAVEDGNVRWSFARDVLEDASIENDLLLLSFMDSEPVALDITSGSEARVQRVRS